MSGAAAILGKCCCDDGGLGCHYIAENCDNPADLRSITCDSHPEGDTRPSGTASAFAFHPGTGVDCFVVPAGQVPVSVTGIPTVEVGRTFADCAACNAIADCGDCPTSYSVTASGIDLDNFVGDPLCTLAFTHVVTHTGGVSCVWQWQRAPGGWTQCDELAVELVSSGAGSPEESRLRISICSSFGSCIVGGSYCTLILEYVYAGDNSGSGFCPHLGTYAFDHQEFFGQNCGGSAQISDPGTVTVS